MLIDQSLELLLHPESKRKKMINSGVSLAQAMLVGIGGKKSSIEDMRYLP
jgi:hypothetical protein